MLRASLKFQRLSDLAHKYDVILSDVWGVVHDGVAIHPAALDALRQFRELGGSVVLLSNASRLGSMVNTELERLGMVSTAYDALITSGDISRDFLSRRPGISVFDLGPGKASTVCQSLDVQFTGLHEADLAVSAGAFLDDTKSIEQLLPTLHAMLARGLLLVCANPDAVTQIGTRKVKCAGALAETYESIGGAVLYAGKPHTLIFERALAVVADLRKAPINRERILVIGDSLRTDIAGAARHGFDSLFVASGIHADELGPSPASSALVQLFNNIGFAPSASTWRLCW